jgi:hypothetical protein
MVSVCRQVLKYPLSQRTWLSRQGIVEDLLQRGIAEHSEGAVCIPVQARAVV